MSKTRAVLFKKPTFTFCALFILAFWIWTPKSNKFINPKHAPKDTPKEQFAFAKKLFDEKNYKRAAEEFTNLTTSFKDSDLAPEAQYYVGRSHEEAGRYYSAFEAYQRAVDVYPFTERIDEIMEREYGLGRIFYKKHRAKLMGKEIITDLDRAMEIFERIKENVPYGEYADKAQFMIGECYKKTEQYNEATKAFQEVVDEYPGSALVDKAKYEVAQSAYLASLQAEYDQELTDEAIKEFKKVVAAKSFSVSEEARKAISLLENKKAEGLLRTAEFYERLKHHESAKIYYREILEKYPRTSCAGLARERLE